MSLASRPGVPKNIAIKQKSIMARKGYHLIFDTPCKLNHFERYLPCPVEGGLCIHLFLRQLPYTRRLFRFCINYHRRNHYVEVGDYTWHEKRVIRIIVDKKQHGELSTSYNPKPGDYFYLEFRFTGTQMFEGYFKDTFIAAHETIFSELQHLYVHDPVGNRTELLSVHCTRSDGRSTLRGNIPDTNLGFTLPTSTLYVHGRYTGRKDDRLIKFSAHEYGNRGSTETRFELDPGEKRPDIIKIEVMSFLIVARAGDAQVVATTKVLGGDYKKTCVVRVEKNFSVDSVRIQTGMFNESGSEGVGGF